MNERAFRKRLDWMIGIEPFGRFRRLSMSDDYANAYSLRPSAARDWTSRFSHERIGYDFDDAWDNWCVRRSRRSFPTSESP